MWVVFPTPKFTELTHVADTEINASFEDVCGLIHRTMMTPPLPLPQDLLNFDDPLNIDAAEHHLRDKVRRVVRVIWYKFGTLVNYLQHPRCARSPHNTSLWLLLTYVNTDFVL